MTRPCIALFGGSGFIGTVLANQLARAGMGVRVFTRSREHARELWLLPETEVIAIPLADEERVAQSLQGCSAAINLIGILNERRDNGADFRRAHVDNLRHIIKACKSARVPHLVHMSALKADVSAPSHYLRSKGEAEKLLQGESGRQLRTSVLRPSVVFGPHDDFLNRFAALLGIAPVLPLTGADALLQPVYVGDVVAALLAIVQQPRGATHSVYEIGGPEVVSLRAVVEMVARLRGQRPWVIPIGGVLATLMAWCMEWVPGKPLTRDNLRSLSVPSTCTGDNALVTLGIRPTPMSEIVPAYLAARTLRGRYDHYREDARGVARTPRP